MIARLAMWSRSIRKIADLSTSVDGWSGASAEQQQVLPSCTGELSIDYQIITFWGQPFLVQNIVLTTLFECTAPNLVLCSDILTGAITPQLTVGIENGDPNDCLVQTAPPAISVPGAIALAEASVIDTVTGATANFGPYLIILD